MDCKSCKEAREVVSRHIHESDLDRLERINKRWFFAWLITFLILVGCVAGFVYYESQWEVVNTVEVTQENDNGYNSYIGNDGDIYNGETNNQAHKEQDS